jgi:hypothetical protein
MKFGQRRTMAGIGIILLITLLVGAHTEAVAASRNADPTASPDVLLYAETTNGIWPEEMTRIFSDGSSTNPFRVPAHKVLVVTSVTWNVLEGLDYHATFALLIRNLQDNSKVQYGPFASFSFGPTTIGAQSVNQTFSTGFVVSEQVKIYPFPKSAGGSGQGFLGEAQVWVMGYLRAAP